MCIVLNFNYQYGECKEFIMQIKTIYHVKQKHEG